MPDPDVVNIAACGALVDHSGTAIQRALDTGRNVYIPPGIFGTTRTLRPGADGQKIYGSGTLIGPPSISIFDLGRKSDLTLEGFTVTHGITSGWTLEMPSAITDKSGPAHRVKFKNVTVRETGFFGICADQGSTEWIVESCHFYRTGRDAVDIRGGHSHRIVGCYAEETGDDAFVITNRRCVSAGRTITEAVTDCVIANNVAVRPGHLNMGGSGIRVAGRRMLVTGNDIREPNWLGIAVSSLDADGSVRPDQITVTKNRVTKLNPSKVDGGRGPILQVAALLLRDVDTVVSGGNTWDCQGDQLGPVGCAYLLRNNHSGGAQNGTLAAAGDTVMGAETVVRVERIGTRAIHVSGGAWERCDRPFRFAQQLDIGHIELRDLEARSPRSNAFFTRDAGEAGVALVEAQHCRITGPTPTTGPFAFGTDRAKIASARIFDCDLNGAPPISFEACVSAAFNGDASREGSRSEKTQPARVRRYVNGMAL